MSSLFMNIKTLENKTKILKEEHHVHQKLRLTIMSFYFYVLNLMFRSFFFFGLKKGLENVLNLPELETLDQTLLLLNMSLTRITVHTAKEHKM